jgi:hypothetical protein
VAIWMLDLNADDLPVRAHLIVSDTGDTRTTACGKTVNEFTHHRGWWELEEGKLPLQPRWIHCGR